MHFSIVIALVLSLTASALAQRRKAEIFNTMFPACKSVGDAMQTKFMDYFRSGQIGPRTCKGKNQATCMKNDVKKVRCGVTETPSEECVAQINAFIQGNDCNA